MATKDYETEDGRFIFTAGGESIEMTVPTVDVWTPDFFRRHRTEGESITFSLLEALAGASGLDYSGVSWQEHRENIRNLDKHTDEVMGLSVGESAP